MELDQITSSDFRPHLGSEFRITFPDGVYTLTLSEVKDLKPWEEQKRLGFTLTFRGQSKAILPQGMWGLQHDDLGSLELFLVPMQPDQEGPLYEAVFN